MPDYRAAAAEAARRYGLGDWFVRQISQESGFNPKARSSAGAQGIAQIVPKWHPDAPGANDPLGQLDWAAKYMRGLVDKYGDPAKALSVYNSGRPDAFRDPKFAKGQTYNYVRSILRGTTPAAGGAVPVPPSLPAASPVPTSSTPTPGLPDLTGAVLANLSTTDSAKQLSNLALAVAAPRPPTQQTALPAASPLPQVPTMPGGMPGADGNVVLAAGADRKGARTSQGVLDFVGQIAGLYGKPLTIGTGTRHNQYVVGTDRESAHWTGHAADIPSSGAALTKLGQTALVAAGMDPAKAAKVRGGLFNLGPYQVIFNTREGGNHFNHLHVGLRSE